MADLPPLPAVGAKPWSLNPHIQALNAESSDTAQTVNFGRLSPSNVDANIEARAVPRLNAATTVLDAMSANDFGAATTNTDVQNATALNAANTAGGGRPVLAKSGRYQVSATFTSENVNLKPQGVLVQPMGKNLIVINQGFGPALDFSHSPLIFGPANPTSNNVATMIVTKVTVPSNSYTGFTAGDIYHFYSNNPLPYGEQAYSTGEMVLPAEFGTLLGIGIDITDVAGGGPQEGTTMTSGGVTAVIQSAIPMDSTTSKIIVKSLSSNLNVGDDISVGGITVGKVGSVYLVFREVFEYSYTTSQKMRKLDTSKSIDLDLTIDTDGDTDALVSSANRQPAIRIVGGYNIRVRARVKGAWTRAIELTACYGGEVDLVVDGLPNHAITSEGAFGYGIELRGATTGVRIKAIGRNLRHLITTNPSLVRTTGSNSFANSDPARFGGQRDCIIHDSIAIGCQTAGFDTHEGAIGMVFDNCISSQPGSGNRFNTTGVGFQNRSFNTIFRNCVSIGGLSGFIEGGMGINRGKPFKNVYENCRALEYQRDGFRDSLPSLPVQGGTWEMVNCVSRGDGTAQGSTYLQSGYTIGRSRVTNALMRNCTAERFNYAPISFINDNTASASKLTILSSFYADYTECDTNALGMTSTSISTASTQPEINVFNYSILGTSTARPPSIFENTSGNVTWNIDPVGVAQLARLTTPVWRTIAGTPTFNLRRFLEVRSYSAKTTDADFTLGRGDSTMQVVSAALTANRTVTLPTTAGSMIRGQEFRFSHRGSGSSLVIGSTGKTLAPGQWCDVLFTGSSWIVTASGTI